MATSTSGPSRQRRLLSIRNRADRPGQWQLLGRGAVIVVTNTLALGLIARFTSLVTFDSNSSLTMAGLAIGVLNGVIWPSLSAVIAPISVLTLGVGGFMLSSFATWAILNALPGVEVESVWRAFFVSLLVTLFSTVINALFAVNDDAWADQSMALRVARRRSGTATDTPGVVFIQIDGLSRPVFEHALQAGVVPTLYSWLADGQHEMRSWVTEWSSQTGVSQCGILHGSVDDLPAFRWYEKDGGRLMVSNHPGDAAEIERRHSDGNGLLSHHGSSYGNLFSGDAERAVLTMSNGGRIREGRIGAGYFGYFAHPGRALRTLYASVADAAHEWWSAASQVRRGVNPRVHRGFLYAFLRVFTTTISRDVCVSGILRDMAEGRASIYVDFLGYDEVAHHSGPERSDAMAVLSRIDDQIKRIASAARFCDRPYRIVVLSDHGQTQGPSFVDKYGTTIATVVGDLTESRPSTVASSEQGKTESSAWLRPHSGRSDDPVNGGEPLVLGSGNLALVYLPGDRRRLTRAEIEQRYPQLIKGLATHEGVGFILVAESPDSSVAIGPSGSHNVRTGEIVGDDPLEVFGPHAATKVAAADRYPHCADIMINSAYDTVRDEVTAFELQVGSHGGLGGNQMHPFLLAPRDMSVPDDIVGPVGLHQVLKQYLADLGQPVQVAGRQRERHR